MCKFSGKYKLASPIWFAPRSPVADLLGLPILGYSLDIGKEHVNLTDERLENLGVPSTKDEGLGQGAEGLCQARERPCTNQTDVRPPNLATST
ncbi:uncharacterized protein LOC126598844 isoform X2 [Malus sylvestris]|uniref:uncharacterized protein LOC126598844 isoform X2 n=1 Tax=Malus sylvestris TaxID=3752 RepID=UPI0021AD2D1F|nr:uncharacterized protein LOC126598844 isoform X2 [Malus sylvestris]